MMITNFPLMIVAFLAYNAVIFGIAPDQLYWGRVIFSQDMPSGAIWDLRLHDLMVILGLFLLFFEILKATRVGKLSIVDHLLSTIILIAFIIEFLVVQAAGTSTFLILTLMALIDVMAGFSVSIRSATRDVSLGDGSGL